MLRFLFRGWFFRVLTLAIIIPNALFAQYQKKPPDFGNTYSFPTPVHPEPSAEWLRTLDVGLLALALGLAAWLVFKSRSRKGVILLSLGSLAYFGFYRKGCICPVGAIQNVVLCLTNAHYVMSIGVIALFFLPLLAALLFGRVFCSGVCPLGAIQDLVLLRPIRVPSKLDKALRWLQYVYLGLAVFFAGWGLQLTLGGRQIKIGQRFLICEWDPFVPLFRRSGAFYMVAIGAAFLLAGMFVGRPYCRWLCPYGGILAVLSRVSWKNLRITPDKELDCGMCADSCPYGAIENLRADRASCLTCTRCYESCPRQKRLVALRAGPRRAAPVPAVPRRWEAVARTWTGIVAALIVAVSAGWLFAAYVHAKRVLPAEKLLVASLKEKAKNDADVQKILQPELNRQHEAAVARRHVYDRGGAILLIFASVLMAWLTQFRPAHGTGAGIPAACLKYLEKPPDTRKRKSVAKNPLSRNQSDDSTGVDN
jgi:polyferredoxin